MKRPLFDLLSAMVTMLVVCGVTIAQAPGASTPQTPNRIARLHLIVTDGLNHSLDDVSQDQIQVFEDKIPQKISLFSKDERPVDYALVLDTSGSFRKLLPAAVEAANVILSNNRLDDETFIERFVSTDKIETLQEFTSDKARLLKSVASLYIEGGQSAVTDAVYLAVKHVAEHRQDPNRRRALVLVTDGEDRASYYSEEQLFQLLSENDVQIFVIGITSQLEGVSGPGGTAPRQKAERLLARLAQETGGRAFSPKNITELGQVAGEIAHDLHSQYLLSYEPANTGTNNFHTIEVKINESPGSDKLTTVTRPGYFVNPPDSNVKEKEKDKKKKSKG